MDLIQSFMEVFRVSVQPMNLPFTVLLLLVLVYWIVYILGAVGMDALDVDTDLDMDTGLDADLGGDLDVDADVGIDGDLDTDAGLDGAGGAADAAAGGSHGLGHSFFALLRFMHFGEAPSMVVISILVYTMWMISVFTSYYFNWGGYYWMSLVMFIPIFIVAAFITKSIVWPFLPLLRKMKEKETLSSDLVGQTCMVQARITQATGQAECKRDGAPFVFQARTRSENPIPRGSEALILEWDPESRVFMVAEMPETPIETR